MIEVEHRFVLHASLADAFAYLADPAHDAQWQKSCSAVERDGATPEEGSTYRIAFDFLGRRLDFRGEITQRVPGRTYAFRATGPFAYRGRYGFEAVAGGVEVHWHFAAEPGGFFGILPLSLVRKFLLSQMEGDAAGLQARFARTVHGPAGMP